MCLNARCVLDVVHLWQRAPPSLVLGAYVLGPPWGSPAAVLDGVLTRPRPMCFRPWSGIDEASTWADVILRYTTILRRAVGSGDPTVRRLTDWGQWAVELLLHTAALPGASWQRKSYGKLRHYVGAVSQLHVCTKTFGPLFDHQCVMVSSTHIIVGWCIGGYLPKGTCMCRSAMCAVTAKGCGSAPICKCSIAAAGHWGR